VRWACELTADSFAVTIWNDALFPRGFSWNYLARDVAPAREDSSSSCLTPISDPLQSNRALAGTGRRVHGQPQAAAGKLPRDLETARRGGDQAPPGSRRSRHFHSPDPNLDEPHSPTGATLIIIIITHVLG
jgi:hypothetical protein